MNIQNTWTRMSFLIFITFTLMWGRGSPWNSSVFSGAQDTSVDELFSEASIPENGILIFQNGDVKPTTGGVSFADDDVWEVYQNGQWLLRHENIQSLKPTGRIIIDKASVSAGNNTGHVYSNELIVTAGGTLLIEERHTHTNYSSWLRFLSSGSTLTVQNGGQLIISGDIHLEDVTLNVESGGELILNHPAMLASHPFWAGTENLMNGSTVRIHNWDFTKGTNSSLFNDAPDTFEISYNAEGYKFGNLRIDITDPALLQNHWILIGGSSFPLLNLCYNHFEIFNSSSNNFITGTASSTSGFVVNGDLLIHKGWFNFGTRFSGGAQHNEYIVRGDFHNLSGHPAYLQYNEQGTETGHTGSLSVGGDIVIGEQVAVFGNHGMKKILLSGGDDLYPKRITVFAPMISVPIEIMNGHRKLASHLVLGTNSSFTVKSGAMFDFGFGENSSDPYALSILRNPNQTGQKFDAEDGSYLKITSPEGITKGGTYAGNVQVGSSEANRIFGSNAVYHYTGRQNQASGDGLPGIPSSKKVIIELETTNPQQDNLTFTISGLKRFTSSGEVEIRSGTVLDAPSNGFADATSEDGKLTMSGGRYRISRGGTQPSLGGKYTLTGGVIEFAGNSAIRIRSGLPAKEYHHIEVSGTNVAVGTTEAAGLTFQPSGRFSVNTGAVFYVDNPDGFHGGNNTAIKSVNTPDIFLNEGSTVVYSRNGNQKVTAFKPLTVDMDNVETGGYFNLRISGDNDISASQPTAKTIENTVFVRNFLEVASGAVLAVPSGTNLMVNRKISTLANAHLIVEHDGNLVQIEDVTANENSGPVTLRKNTAQNPDHLINKYLFWSSPVAEQNMYDIFNEGNPQYVMSYNTNTDYYTVLENPANAIAGMGYSVKTPNGSGVSYNGVPNNGSFSLSVHPVPNENSNAYHLIGNPYPSNFNLSAFYQDNSANIGASFYFWNHKTASNTIQTGAGGSSTWAVFNAASGTWNESSDVSGMEGIVNGSVRPGQGFIIKALNDVVFFRNSHRHGDVATSFNRSFTKNDMHYGKFWIELMTPLGISYSTAVTYGGGTNELDLFDSPIMNTAPSLYTVLSDQRLLIQGRDHFQNEDSVSLGVNTGESGTFRFHLSGVEGLFTNDIPIILRDKILNINIDLRKQDYLVDLLKGAADDRFQLVYQKREILDAYDSPQGIKINFYHNGDFYFAESPDKIKSVFVYDLSGRLIYKKQANRNKISIPIQNKGLFWVHLLLDNGQSFSRKLMF